MPARIDRVINSQTGLNLVTYLARSAPPWLGYALAGNLARFLSSRRQSEQVRAVRANQWVVQGEELSREELDRAVRCVFRSAARSIYELYHFIHDPKATERLYAIEPSALALLHRPEFEQRGLIVVGLHLSGFDLALQWICTHWVKPLVLTIPNPEGGRQLEFEIRKKTGMNLVPGSVNGLRQAIRYLQQGGMVATGIDRPSPDSLIPLRFFGRPARLPTHHIYLALKTNAPVIVVISRLEDDGRYHIVVSPPIEMDRYPDREEQLVFNAEKVLSTAEGFIRQSPHHWVITQPVWPETVGLAPG